MDVGPIHLSGSPNLSSKVIFLQETRSLVLETLWQEHQSANWFWYLIIWVCQHIQQGHYYHQKKLIFPAVLKYWENYQSRLINDLKEKSDLVWCGDGRFNSMGHCAKYGAYTMIQVRPLPWMFKLVDWHVIKGNNTIVLEELKFTIVFVNIFINVNFSLILLEQCYFLYKPNIFAISNHSSII